MREIGRSIGLDVHRDFCEVAITEAGEVRSAERVQTTPMSDLFSAKGRRWLRSLELPLEESETLEGCMRHVEFLDAEIEAVERLIASQALDVAQQDAGDRPLH